MSGPLLKTCTFPRRPALAFLPPLPTINHPGPQDAPRYQEGPPLQLHQALYWSWVTVATVGYGDYAPSTVLAQCLFPLVIVVMLLVLPAKISNLGAIMQVGCGVRVCGLGSVVMLLVLPAKISNLGAIMQVGCGVRVCGLGSVVMLLVLPAKISNLGAIMQVGCGVRGCGLGSVVMLLVLPAKITNLGAIMQVGCGLRGWGDKAVYKALVKQLPSCHLNIGLRADTCALAAGDAELFLLSPWTIGQVAFLYRLCKPCGKGRPVITLVLGGKLVSTHAVPPSTSYHRPALPIWLTQSVQESYLADCPRRRYEQPSAPSCQRTCVGAQAVTGSGQEEGQSHERQSNPDCQEAEHLGPDALGWLGVCQQFLHGGQPNRCGMWCAWPALRLLTWAVGGCFVAVLLVAVWSAPCSFAPRPRCRLTFRRVCNHLPCWGLPRAVGTGYRWHTVSLRRGPAVVWCVVAHRTQTHRLPRLLTTGNCCLPLLRVAGPV